MTRFEQARVQEAFELIQRFATDIADAMDVTTVPSGQMLSAVRFGIMAPFLFDIERQEGYDVELWTRGEVDGGVEIELEVLHGETRVLRPEVVDGALAEAIRPELESLRAVIEAALVEPRVLAAERAGWRETRWVPETIARTGPHAEALAFLTDELKGAPGSPWADLRSRLLEAGIQPDRAWIGELYPHQPREEHGVIATLDGRYFAFVVLEGIQYVDDDPAWRNRREEFSRDRLGTWRELGRDLMARSYPEVFAQSPPPRTDD